MEQIEKKYIAVLCATPLSLSSEQEYETSGMPQHSLTCWAQLSPRGTLLCPPCRALRAFGWNQFLPREWDLPSRATGAAGGGSHVQTFPRLSGARAGWAKPTGHRILDWFGLEGTLELLLFQIPSRSRDNSIRSSCHPRLDGVKASSDTHFSESLALISEIFFKK